jgi:hypothetical protein
MSGARELLSSLASVPSELGRFVAGYLSSDEALPQAWLNDWFVERTNRSMAVEEEGDRELIPEEVLNSVISTNESVVAESLTLLALKPVYFRGFRDTKEPIVFGPGLVVCQGRNSMGKTSLVEAIEWLFTGGLLRRALHQLGNARELESCVGNIFRPITATTYVEARFRKGSAEEVVLRRVLVSDYGVTTTSNCVSQLSLDGHPLSPEEERKALSGLIGSVPPILMQHTLRLFVQSSPADRRKYFEELLQLDQLTHLIERGVVGEKAKADFKSPKGNVGLSVWLELSAKAPTSCKAAVRFVSTCARADLRAKLEASLLVIAEKEFGSGLPDSGVSFPDRIRAAQKKVRQESFPLLKDIRPRRALDDSTKRALSCDEISIALTHARSARKALDLAKAKSADITAAQLAIATALKALADAGLVATDLSAQVCPVCEDERATLSRTRVNAIESWNPAMATLKAAEGEARNASAKLLSAVKAHLQLSRDLIPRLPSEASWSEAVGALPVPLASLAASVADTSRASVIALAKFDAAGAQITAFQQAAERSPALNEDVIAACDRLCAEAPALTSQAVVYRQVVKDFEEALGSHAKEDPVYARRELWLTVDSQLDDVIHDLLWERAKTKTQKELEIIRSALIAIRQDLLNARRDSFSVGMSEIWSLLRAETFARFKALEIPEPRGRGFPVEIEVKAELNGPESAVSVDALRVFSDSQINALGICAFVTRSLLLGHKMVVFDDPVQSMDEEHFQSFASSFLADLSKKGMQVIVLTHNDLFARDVSFVNEFRDDYLTLEIMHSRKNGCWVEDGNRRVSERLKSAERKAEESDLDAAWYRVRLALERLYTLVRKRHGADGFDPSTWENHSGENMWKEGVGELVEKLVPGCGKDLQRILKLTAAGAHDKASRGETDLRNATKYIRGLLNPFRAGD